MSKIGDFIDKWIAGPLWHLIWPRQCAMCEKVLRMDEEIFCHDCRKNLPKTEEGWHRDNRVECIFSNIHKFERGAAYCFYPKGHPIRNAVQIMKFDSHPEVGRELGRMAAEEWKDSGFFDGIDCLVPLPLHKSRLRERGYNQAEWIAKGIQDVTGLPIDTKHLVRFENNAHQSKMNLEERRTLGEIFRVNKPEEWRGRHLLLIDDVITSGTTMLRAMEVIHPIPRCHYSVFAIAVAHD